MARFVCIHLGGADAGPLAEALRGRGATAVTARSAGEGLAALATADGAVLAAPAWDAAAEALVALRARHPTLPLLVLLADRAGPPPAAGAGAIEEIVLPAPWTAEQLGWGLRAAEGLAARRGGREEGRLAPERGHAAAHDLACALTATLELPEILDLIARRLPELVRCAFWSILLVDERLDEVVFEVKGIDGKVRIGEIRSPVGHGLVESVARAGQPILVADAPRDERCRLDAGRFASLAARAVAGLPLRARGRTVGVLLLANRGDGRPFDQADVAHLAPLADYAAIALANARSFERAKELALTDELTQLGNLRYFNQMLDRELSRARRRGARLACLFLDLDQFKRVNDRHGHPMGSALLREVSRLLRAAVRTVDVVARYGGDEFVVLLPDTGAEQAFVVAERLRLRLAGESFLQAHGLAVQITGSIGIAVYPDQARTPQELLQAADDAMYRAKGDRRNQTFYSLPADEAGPFPERR
jgi:diguanylate cyclase (GGDEF)-like protein